MKAHTALTPCFPIRLKYGNTNTYLIGNLLVDTDMAGTLTSFGREVKKHGISPDQIKYVLVTHFHPDHMGLVGKFMQKGIKLILLEHQTAYVHSSDAIYNRNPRTDFMPIDEKNAIVISVKESRSFLSNIGIEGEIIITKSHSPDGAALILDDGTAFVGDLEPREFIDGYRDNTPLREDWKNLLSHGVKIIHYGHANDGQIP